MIFTNETVAVVLWLSDEDSVLEVEAEPIEFDIKTKLMK